MFDMLTGLPPFLADSKRETQQLVLHGSIKLPAYLSPEAKDLLRKLLQRNQKNRLGGGGEDYVEIIVSNGSCSKLVCDLLINLSKLKVNNVNFFKPKCNQSFFNTNFSNLG